MDKLNSATLFDWWFCNNWGIPNVAYNVKESKPRVGPNFAFTSGNGSVVTAQNDKKTVQFLKMEQ